MRSVLRVVLTVLVVGSSACTLGPELFPGWTGTGCTSDDACIDDEPCSVDWCDIYGVCQHDNDEEYTPSDTLECTEDTCKDGRPSHEPRTGAPCGGQNGKMFCDDGGHCAGCAPLTAAEDCGGLDYYCDGSICQQRLPPGRPCIADDNCTTGVCRDDMCCDVQCSGICQSCRKEHTDGEDGVCLPILLGLDPHAECDSGLGCNGIGLCAGTLAGEPCADPIECLTGLCVDGVCCVTSCEGTCKACDLPGALGACVNIPSGQDPQDECPGVTDCAGNGACALLPLGAGCTMNIECSGGGHCADGYCCDSLCSGACKACNLAGSVGTCANIPAGQDPDNECAGALNCDGAGACQ